MSIQEETPESKQAQLTLYRFASNAVDLDLLKDPVQPEIQLQIFANAYLRGHQVHETVLRIKIEAKHHRCKKRKQPGVSVR